VTERTFKRLHKKWPYSSFEDFYDIQQMLSRFRKAGVSVPRSLDNLDKVPGLFMLERLESLLSKKAAWNRVRGCAELRAELKKFLDYKRSPGSHPPAV